MLGVTGQIKSTGAGTPILTKAGGGLNYIATINGGKGISTQTAPQGGVMVKSTLANAAVNGSSVLMETQDAAQTLRRVIAGDGISITENSDTIEIASATATISSKTVIVNEESDLPTPIAGVITLADNTDYLFTTDISTSNRFVVGDNCVVRAADNFVVTLTYTGFGDMFTGGNKAFAVKNITIAADSANQLFNLSSTDPTQGVLIMLRVNFGATTKLGTLDNIFGVEMSGCSVNGVTNGFTFANNITFSIFSANSIAFTSGTFLDLNGGRFDGLSLINNGIVVTAGGTVLTGEANSANINAGGLGVVSNNRKNGGTFLSAISADDSRWNFSLNDDIADTRPDALLSFITPTTTTITTVSTPVIVDGTWTVERVSQFSATAGGRVAYLGEKPAILPITVRLSIEPINGSDRQISVYLAKNGVIIPNSRAQGTASTLDPASITVIWQDEVSPNDFYEVYIANETNINNLIVDSGQFRIN